MLNGSKLRPKFKITNSRIEHIKTGSYIKPLSKDDGRNGDGTNPAVLVLDNKKIFEKKILVEGKSGRIGEA